MGNLSWLSNNSANATSGNIWISTSANTIPYPQHAWETAIQYHQLPPVQESPSRALSDREWLDAQVSEVCALA